MHVRTSGPGAVPAADVLGLLAGPATAPAAAAAAAADRSDPLRRWAAGVAFGGLGYYAAAAAILEPLSGSPEAGPDLRAHAIVTRASHLRQLGGHGAAAALDGRALRTVVAGTELLGAEPVGTELVGPELVGRESVCLARDVPDPWGLGAGAAVADALTGLAADALGRFDTRTAGGLLARAAPWCGGHGHRSRVRHDWVVAETALVAGDPAAALEAAGRALSGARLLGSARHVLKSRLVRAVAAGVAGEDPAEVLAELDAVAAAAWESGLLPLHRPALLAGDDLAVRTGLRPPSGPGDGPSAGAGRTRTGHRTADRAMPDGLRPADARARHAGASRFDTRSRQTDAEGRRSAVLRTVSVLYTRSDRPGRDLLRE
ncbi:MULTISPECIES: hypothetical protein [Pseudonocardia]|uniref:Uncharacterized protein n=2 Tax=Pseudonocardia TaxID=1847 RepID=A0A1Y2N1J0_PSEAH|nr:MULTISPECIES: hypothetical protein [Pseudonocardia]OSY41059.1 hypothetical protein BG845_02401 [Pseudonocardia autotrophica]TDN73814.1 hypothetical protein C8E95_2920 [Pseudonocardia autotrophica]BBG04560.1 hypothetical protein Pdca_57690 [Pseudonocardia autotrophica]GEC28938.1 hypothetical protein PSA01_59670 [Pseudonocardia saturnea]